MRIGVFDSGVGGLTVLKELINKFPNNEYIYVGDTIHLPYGNKDINSLRSYVKQIMTFLLDKNVEIVIIACGTISATLGKEIKKDYKIPVIDIISPTIAYLQRLNDSWIGVLATENTVSKKIFSHALIHKKVTEVACPKLVPAIEKGQSTTTLLSVYLNSLQHCDAIVLGCTHYPIIKNEIQRQVKAPLISMGEVLAEQVHLSNTSYPSIKLYFSSWNDIISKNITMILGSDTHIEISML